MVNKKKQLSGLGNCKNGMCVPGTGKACESGKDCCKPGTYGPYPDCPYKAAKCDPPCENGYCSPQLGECVCPTDGHNFQTFWGPQCATPVCPSLCLGQGTCNAETGKCTCYHGFSGEDCGTVDDNIPCLAGPNGVVCNGNGTCNQTTGECTCNPGYSGQVCETKKPDPACMGGKCGVGTCSSDGTCICPINAGGSNCESVMARKVLVTPWQTIVWRLLLVLLAVTIIVMLFLLFTGRLEKYSTKSHQGSATVPS